MILDYQIQVYWFAIMDFEYAQVHGWAQHDYYHLTCKHHPFNIEIYVHDDI